MSKQQDSLSDVIKRDNWWWFYANNGAATYGALLHPPIQEETGTLFGSICTNSSINFSHSQLADAIGAITAQNTNEETLHVSGQMSNVKCSISAQSLHGEKKRNSYKQPFNKQLWMCRNLLDWSKLIITLLVGNTHTQCLHPGLNLQTQRHAAQPYMSMSVFVCVSLGHLCIVYVWVEKQ